MILLDCELRPHTFGCDLMNVTIRQFVKDRLFDYNLLPSQDTPRKTKMIKIKKKKKLQKFFGLPSPDHIYKGVPPARRV